jgi:RimJ/RimL family protein N-acetyltransferase
VFATVFSRNIASSHVLENVGMRHEGTMRRHIRKWDEYVDVELYAIVKTDWPLT